MSRTYRRKSCNLHRRPSNQRFSYTRDYPTEEGEPPIRPGAKVPDAWDDLWFSDDCYLFKFVAPLKGRGLGVDEVARTLSKNRPGQYLPIYSRVQELFRFYDNAWRPESWGNVQQLSLNIIEALDCPSEAFKLWADLRVRIRSIIGEDWSQDHYLWGRDKCSTIGSDLEWDISYYSDRWCDWRVGVIDKLFGYIGFRTRRIE